MRPEQMRPFVESTIEVFQQMLGVRLREGAGKVTGTQEGDFDLSAFIGLSGKATASFVLSASSLTARRIVGAMLRETADTELDLADGMGEFINIIAGTACRKLGRLGFEGLALSLPAVVSGTHRVIWPSREIPGLSLCVLDSELGSLSIEVNMRSAS